MKLQGLTPERPLTHDLFATTLEELGVRVDRVVISDLADETFHARLVLEGSGKVVEVDARPSDALALAVRTGVRIFAADSVLDQAGLGADGGLEDDEEGGDAGTLLEIDRRAGRGPAARCLPRLRQLARRRPRRRGPPGQLTGRGQPRQDRAPATQRARAGSPTCAAGAARSRARPAG